MSNRGYSRFRNLNIVGLQGGGVTGTPLATPLETLQLEERLDAIFTLNAIRRFSLFEFSKIILLVLKSTKKSIVLAILPDFFLPPAHFECVLLV